MGDKTVEELQKAAVGYFCTRPSNFPVGRPYNCCESVLLALREYLGEGASVVPKIGTVIGAGVSLNGLLCGCVSSVALAIGMKNGRTSAEESPQRAWDLVDKYVAEFRRTFGNTDCRQLTGVDLKTKEGFKEYYERIHDYACAARIRFAVGKAAQILQI